MARTTPRSYFEDFVLPNYEEFSSERSVQRTFNAAVPAYHLANVVFEFCHKHNQAAIAPCKSFAEYRNHLRAGRPDFSVVDDMTQAYKHLYPTHVRHNMDSPGQVVVEVNASVPKALYTDDHGKHYKDVFSVLKAVVDMWQNELNRLSAKSSMPW